MSEAHISPVANRLGAVALTLSDAIRDATEAATGMAGGLPAALVSLSEWADLTYRDRGVRVMALLPGFTRTEFHSRMQVSRQSAPAWMWLDADRLVSDGLRDLARGRRVSVPSRRYKVLAAAARYTPTDLQARFQGLGRR